jgi:hypothetical protein
MAIAVAALERGKCSGPTGSGMIALVFSAARHQAIAPVSGVQRRVPQILCADSSANRKIDEMRNSPISAVTCVHSGARFMVLFGIEHNCLF